MVRQRLLRRGRATIDGDEIVYIEINRWQPQGGGRVYFSNRDVQRALSRLEKCGIDAPKVVARSQRSSRPSSSRTVTSSTLQITSSVSIARSLQDVLRLQCSSFNVFKKMHNTCNMTTSVTWWPCRRTEQQQSRLGICSQQGSSSLYEMEKDTMIQT